MTRSTPVSASIAVELTLNLTGVYQPAIPMTPPSYASGGDPPEAECVEDIAIETVLFDTLETILPGEEAPFRDIYDKTKRVVTHNLLDGVDTSSKDVIRLLDNLLALVYREAEEALIEDAGK